MIFFGARYLHWHWHRYLGIGNRDLVYIADLEEIFTHLARKDSQLFEEHSIV